MNLSHYFILDIKFFMFYVIFIDLFRDFLVVKTDMAIEVTLDLVLAQRKMRLTELSERIGISMTNLSLLKTGRVKGMRFSTLQAICRELECQPGDILAYVPDFV